MIKFDLDAGWSFKMKWSMCLLISTFLIIMLSLDLSDLFNWNTKQLFVSVVAEYETKTHVS
jgi:hypothetical protein